MALSMLQQWLGCVANALFPARCLGCGGFFYHARRAAPPVETAAGRHADRFAWLMAPDCCPACRVQWTPVTPPFCWCCGLVFASREGDGHLCGQCLTRPFWFHRARAGGIYDQSLQVAIHALKFKAKVHLADPLGAFLFDTFERYWQPGEIDMVVPVPLHRQRFRRRGFNQAYLLVRQWPLPPGMELVRDLLIRNRATPSQTGLSRRQRRVNIRNAFTMARPGKSTDKRVLLVDDVLTTGATVDACAQVLIRDGAAQVDVLTLARAL